MHVKMKPDSDSWSLFTLLESHLGATCDFVSQETTELVQNEGIVLV